jgi:hypothetical protein
MFEEWIWCKIYKNCNLDSIKNIMFCNPTSSYPPRVLGGLKIGWCPRIRDSEANAERSRREGRQEIPESLNSPQKSWTLYTCPRAPFYKDTKGLLHSKITPNLKNITSVNMYTNVFFIPWFAGLISYILQVCHQFTLQTRTFWGDVFDFAFPWPPKLHSWKSSLIEIPELRLLKTPELGLLKTPEIRGFLVSWISSGSNHPETDSRLANQRQLDYYFAQH